MKAAGCSAYLSVIIGLLLQMCNVFVLPVACS